jgi:hypothetical protein
MATLAKENSQLADRNNNPLIGTRQASLTAPVDLATALTAIIAIQTVLEAHGLVASND